MIYKSEGNERGKFVAKILAGIIAGIAALACLLPALSVNIAAHLSKGEPWYAGSVFIVSVLMASVAMIVRPIALRHKEKQVAFACLLVAFGCLSFNLKNALSSATISRTAFGDPRRAEIANIARLESEQKRLSEILAKSSPEEALKSSAEWRAEVAAKEADPIFTRDDRSNRCTNSTIQASATFCQERGALLAGLARADARESTQRDLESINDALGKIDHRPTMADPAVDNLSAFAAMFVAVTDKGREYIGLGTDVHTAVFVELLAAFGPGICFFGYTVAIRRREGPEEGPVAAEERVAVSTDAGTPAVTPGPVQVPKPALAVSPREKKALTAKPIPSCVAAFFDASVVERRGGEIGATDFYDAYVASTSSPVTANMFGRAATARFKKSTGRTNRYVDIALKGRPALVAVG